MVHHRPGFENGLVTAGFPRLHSRPSRAYVHRSHGTQHPAVSQFQDLCLLCLPSFPPHLRYGESKHPDRHLPARPTDARPIFSSRPFFIGLFYLHSEDSRSALRHRTFHLFPMHAQPVHPSTGSFRPPSMWKKRKDA